MVRRPEIGAVVLLRQDRAAQVLVRRLEGQQMAAVWEAEEQVGGRIGVVGRPQTGVIGAD